MTEDNVNRPAHYNKNGIEVIDVIETYTPNSPHLANVLKYVCRHAYKGKPLEDLKKARWYLDRAISIREEQDAIFENPIIAEVRDKIKFAILNSVDDEDFEAARDAYGRVFRTSPPVNIEGEEFDLCFVCGADLDPDLDYEDFADGHKCDDCYSLTDDFDPGFPGEHDPEPESVVDALYVRTSPSRIAGDDDAAMRIKADYYRFDPFAIVGYCANCDKELSADDNFLQGVEGYYSNVKFCSDGCVKKLRAWQGRNPQ